MSDIMFGRSGEITDFSDWPRPLTTIQEAAIELDLEINNVDVYCVADGLCLNEFLWKIKADKELLDYITLNHEELLLHKLYPYTPSDITRFRPQKNLPVWSASNEGRKNHLRPIIQHIHLANSFRSLPFVINRDTLRSNLFYLYMVRLQQSSSCCIFNFL